MARNRNIEDTYRLLLTILGYLIILGISWYFADDIQWVIETVQAIDEKKEALEGVLDKVKEFIS